jgi:hypothetical protein
MEDDMSNQGLFDRVSNLVAEIEQEKTASLKRAMKDPGGYEGPSSHPSTKSDDNELEDAPEGEQSADNTKIVKEEVPDSVDSKPDATPGNVPSSDDVQLGQGVDKAKATGEDPANEEDYKGKPTGDKREGDMGGTSHPADGSFGEKFSADKLAATSDDDLLKLAAELGNEIAADLTNDHFSTPRSSVSPGQAAAAGAQLAKTANEVTPDDLAAAVLEYQVKVAQHQADLVAGHIQWELAELQKAAEAEDPTGGESAGEDNGSEEIPIEGAGEVMPGGEGGGGADELLAAMAGGGGGGEGPPEEAMGGGMPPEAMGGGMPPEAMGGELPPEAMGGAPGGEMGGLDEMGGDEGIQQLAMALLELGIDPQELAAAASGAGQKMASLVQRHKRAGKFRVESPQTRQQKQARDYIRGYVQELMQRNR